MIYTLRFCAWDFLARIAMDGMYAGFAGAKACHEKIAIFKNAHWETRYSSFRPPSRNP
jgi:hypothetical protein